MAIFNLTPHIVRLNSGEEFWPSGKVARVSATHVEVGEVDQEEIPLYRVTFGTVVGLPEQHPDNTYIVSSMVAAAAKRVDVVAPATGHPDCIRKDGQVWSVPGFVMF